MDHAAGDKRDLLFVLQGLQTGLIEKNDLLAAIRQREQDNPRSLRETLLALAAVHRRLQRHRLCPRSRRAPSRLEAAKHHCRRAR
jgi:hypothetical protein